MNAQAERNYKKLQTMQKAVYGIRMIGIFLFFCLMGLFLWMSCQSIDNPLIEIKHVTYRIDSVEFHQIGQDHTMQTTPYWKVHLEKTPYWISSYRMYSVGDSITVTEKRLIEKKNTKVEKTQE